MVLRQAKPVTERRLVYTDVPDAAPAAAEILVRVPVCGVCRTDLQVFQGVLPRAAPSADPRERLVATDEGATRLRHGGPKL